MDLADRGRSKRRVAILEKFNPERHVEIYQLAKTYVNMEDALFVKMSELEERSENLSNELKQRKKAENKLIKAEKYLNNIIQSLQSIIITADSRLKLIHYNDLAEKTASGRGKDLFTKFPFLETLKGNIIEVMKESTSYFGNTISIESFGDRYFNISITPLAGESADGVVIRLDDVTEMKNIQNQLIHTQKWETLGVLTSGFAHDFNNVLTGIVTSTSILIHKVENDYPQLDNSFVGCLNIIDRSGRRAATMVQQLLSLSKSNELVIKNMNINQSVEDIKSICSNSFDKSVSIELELLDSYLPVKADYAQIEQSLLNLCINAYHSMTEMRAKGEKHGGILRISLKKTYVDQFLHVDNENLKPGEYISLAISDTGVGISKEHKAQIFDPFFTTKDKSKGTGLGLTMVQNIVHQHGGFIELYSEPGRGSVFTIYLPVSKDDAPEEQREIISRELIKGKGTILVIDDEDIIRELSESILVQCGYNVITVEDGFKGVDIYREKRNSIELVILDMSMPGISGKETFIQIKQINPEQKILMSSGFSKDERIQDLINLGLEDFIQKPFDFINMSEKVYSIIHSKK
jgi:signal transduction histidine kinase/CheY-like chemotaxis protein